MDYSGFGPRDYGGGSAEIAVGPPPWDLGSGPNTLSDVTRGYSVPGNLSFGQHDHGLYCQSPSMMFSHSYRRLLATHANAPTE